MSNTLLYVITVLIWGSTWFAIEFQLGSVAPEVSVVYRYAISAILLFAWCRARRLDLRFERQAHLWFALLGLCLFSLNYVLAYRAQIHITSALSAIVFSAMLWVNLLLARILFGVRAGARVLFGAVLGIVGIVTMFAPRIGVVSFDDAVFVGSTLAFSGAVVASFGNMASQRAQMLSLPVIQSNAWGMFYGTLLTGAYALIAGYPFTFEASVGYVVSLFYLSVFGSIIAFGAYLTLLGRIGAHKAGYAVVMFPVVALILSTLFEDLRIDLTIVTGTALVLAGNVFVLKGTESKRAP